MPSQHFLFTLVAPALVLGAVFAPQGQASMPSATSINTAPYSNFGVTLFKGTSSGPCNNLSLEMDFNEEYVLNSTRSHCFSTQGLATTCIGRRTKADPGPATNAQAYEAARGGVDAKAHQCIMTGYQQDGCPTGTGTLAQYHTDNGTWSWDHETKIRDDDPGRLWSVMSFHMSCKP